MESLKKEGSLRMRASRPLPPLLHAISTVQKYNCGATYRGPSCNRKRCGVGVFSWPSGETYVGEFDNNRRNGKGY